MATARRLSALEVVALIAQRYGIPPGEICEVTHVTLDQVDDEGDELSEEERRWFPRWKVSCFLDEYRYTAKNGYLSAEARSRSCRRVPSSFYVFGDGMTCGQSDFHRTHGDG